jgi:hypothetical protein
MSRPIDTFVAGECLPWSYLLAAAWWHRHKRHFCMSFISCKRALRTWDHISTSPLHITKIPEGWKGRVTIPTDAALRSTDPCRGWPPNHFVGKGRRAQQPPRSNTNEIGLMLPLNLRVWRPRLHLFTSCMRGCHLPFGRRSPLSHVRCRTRRLRSHS